MLDGGWNTPEVAREQRALVELELENPMRFDPYKEFLRAISFIKPKVGWRLLDVGCGVGHYGTFIRVSLPFLGIRYYGTDRSPYMVEEARDREPKLKFKLCEFQDNDFERYTMVLQALALEVSANPLELAEIMVARTRGYLIWHRLRLADKSGFITEPTYGGHRGEVWQWSKGDLYDLFGKYGRSYSFKVWESRDDMATAVLMPRRKLDK